MHALSPVVLKEFVSHLASAGVIDPHMECHDLKTIYNKNPDGEVTGATTTIKNVVPCCFKVCKRPAHCNAEYDNLGSSLVLGDDAASWDLDTRTHSKGCLVIQDRMVYDESPNIGGMAPLKYGVCLDKAIRIKKDTLRQLA